MRFSVSINILSMSVRSKAIPSSFRAVCEFLPSTPSILPMVFPSRIRQDCIAACFWFSPKASTLTLMDRIALAAAAVYGLKFVPFLAL